MKERRLLTILIFFLFVVIEGEAQVYKPDLVVKDIRVINHCELEVTIANIGNSGVSSPYYSRIAIQMYVDGKAGGGMVLSVFDPNYLLTNPGRTVKINWFPTATKERIRDGLPHTVKVVVDEGNKLDELKENNNSLTKRLSCGNDSQTRLPDIGMYGFLKIGKYRKSIKWGKTIVLTPSDAFFVSNGIPAFDIYYSYREYNNVSTGTFKNKIYFSGELISKQTGLKLNPFQIKNVHTNAYLRPQNGKLEIHIDADNEVIESREDNNYHFFVNIIFEGFDKNLSENKKVELKQFLLSFNDAYLVYTPSSNRLRIMFQRNVLSYGSDWKVVKLKSFLYHFKEKFWKNFYWKVNTSRKEVYLISEGSFGHYGGKEVKLNIKVEIIGNPVSPKRFFLRFHKSYLVYDISSKSLQISTGGKVLSYGKDWLKCNLKPYLFDLKQNIWKGFFWRINTSRKQVYRVSGGTFCGYSGGNYTNLNIGVKIIK